MPAHAIAEQAMPSGGPGGQHANRSATRVELRILVHALPLAAAEHELVHERLATRLTAAGELVLASDAHRSQHRNRIEVRRRAAELLADALRPRRRRRPTRPSRAARQRELERQRAARAQRRQRRWRPSRDDLDQDG